MHDHLLIIWASGQRYATTPQSTSDYITRSTRPSQLFLCRLKTREGLGTRLPLNQVLFLAQHFLHTKRNYHVKKRGITDTLGAGTLSFTYREVVPTWRLTSKPHPSIPRINLLRGAACGLLCRHVQNHPKREQID